MTFILLALPSETPGEDSETIAPDSEPSSSSSSSRSAWTASQIHNQGVMIGDVNLFLPEGPQGEDVECEIMLAEEAYRGKGMGKEALSIL